MADRMDIDALLIGSLYGELTPADQARLQAHLESHPADRSVLADLTRARQVVRESRIFELQFEPPQAVSALLLQEAARRAPRIRTTPNSERSESWFQRFMRSLAAHPAMAAAAMLVVVLGAATILYKRSGAQNWEPSAEQDGVAATHDQKNEKDNFAVDLANDEKLKQQQQQLQQQQQALDAGAVAAPSSAAAIPPPADQPAPEPAAKPPAKAGDPAPRKQPPRDYIEVDRGPQPQPKELGDDAKAKTELRGNKETQAAESAQPRAEEKRSAPSGRVVGGAAPGAPHAGGAGSAATNPGFAGDTTTSTGAAAGPAGGNAGGGAAPAPTSPTNRKLETSKDARRPSAPPPAPASTPAPPPPPPAPAQQPATTGSREKTVQKGADKSDADKPSEDVSWARGQHQKVIAAVKANRCMEATNLALVLENRAPAYYAQNVENDRSIKSCASYIANERAKRVAAEKAARARASERVDEAPKATAPTSNK